MDVNACVFGCGYRRSSTPDIFEHIRLVHPSPAKKTLALNSSQSTNETAALKKRSRSGSSEIQEYVAHQDGKNIRRDPDYQPNSIESEDGLPASQSSRYPQRNQRKQIRKKERNLSRKAELAKKIDAILKGRESSLCSNDSDTSAADLSDPFTQLRLIAAVIEEQLGKEWEVPYEADTQLKDGYIALYFARLQSMISDDDLGNEVLHRVLQLLRAMDDGKIEYQKPDPLLMEKVQKGAANGRDVPRLNICSEVLFYGRDLGDSGWGCGYRNAQARE